jgi:succinate dehydrogenase / fumarate reductase cytochrome b subunit
MTADQRHFYLRRLHSLSGVIPVGVFLVQHMYSNALSLWGPGIYDEHVHFLIYQPLVLVLEIFVVALPLAFHAALGVWFMSESRFNPQRYAYARNWTYTLQRVTAWITLVYVCAHVYQTRFSFSAEQKHAMYSSMQALFEANPVWLMLVYAVGAIAASFHLCNGLWTFCIVWGITVTKSAQDLVWKGAMGLFVLMSLGFVGSLLPLNRIIEPPFGDSAPAKHAEEKMRGESTRTSYGTP